MIIESISNLEQAQHIREIRNSVREYMTRYTDFITPENQVQWFRTYIQSDDEAYLYKDFTLAIVGYGYIRRIDGKCWGSLAVKPEFQGNGWGTAIYKHMIAMARELYIEIYAHNNESISAAIKAGFRLEHTGDTIIVMKGTYDPTF